MRKPRLLMSRAERARVLPKLYALQAEYMHSARAQRTIEDGYIFYAIVGRDRRKLNDQWVAKAREAAQDAIAWDESIRALLAPPDADAA